MLAEHAMTTEEAAVTFMTPGEEAAEAAVVKATVVATPDTDDDLDADDDLDTDTDDGDDSDDDSGSGDDSDE